MKRITIKGVWEVIKNTFSCFINDKVTKLSGALAYFTVFSMGPLLVVLISFCGLFLEKEAVEGQVYSVLRNFIGQDTALQLQHIIENAAIGGKSKIAAIIGVITLVIGATSIFAEIQDSINIIWGIKPKPKKGLLKMLLNRLLSFSVIISLGFLLLVSLVITGVIEALNNRLQAAYPDVTIVVFYIFNLGMTLFTSMMIFGVIFKVLPDARIKWKDVTAGAFVTSLLFLLGKFLISFYISRSHVGSTYGTAGSLVILLLWVYYSSVILYFGAEFTKAYAIKYGSEILPNSYAVTMKQVEVETGKASVQEKEQIVPPKKKV
ncbi:YihY/virulence factor BrkB family protein [Danxiaibacter flavus]|uniref:YihY/virulence factor BrkB family protein n=1 Tax=Danxiaibacter flavus TaxID=3049108 RepID=A0ABV3ZBJ3_9BACT|nr:YihY/virulence factor BrkB family protein [Chitinophagaceae bacterium DXS]